MPKFYFTYGTSRQYDFQGGWTEVEAPSMTAASAAFRVYHPDRRIGVLNCSDVYREEEFLKTDMLTEGNYGAYCHERVVLLRDCSKYTATLRLCSNDSKEDNMANCKFCGTPVVKAKVMHGDCLEKKLHQAAQRICDDYCKYADAFHDPADLHELHCDSCVVTELLALAR